MMNCKVFILFSILLIGIAHCQKEYKYWGWDDNNEKSNTKREAVEPRVMNRNDDFLALPSIEQQTIQEFHQSSNATEASDEEVIEEILRSGRQGRNIEGLDDIYSDPIVKQALDNGDDNEARNLIRDKLCSLGLMQCDEIIAKRPPYPPTRIIYSQPPPGISSNGRPIYRPPPPPGAPLKSPYSPHSKVPYGPPQPVQMPNGPPRKVGYAPNAVYTNNKYGNSYDYEQQSSSAVKFGYTERPTIVVNQTPKIEAASSNVQIHHHYHHVDGAVGTKAADPPKTIVVNNPIPVQPIITSGIAAAQTVDYSQLSSSYQAGATGSGFDSGFIPSNSDYDYKGVNSGSGYYAAQSATKPIVENNQYASQYSQGNYPSQTQASFTDLSSNSLYNQQQGLFSGPSGSGVQGSFHSSAPDFYKKELNINGPSKTNGLSSYNQYSSQNKYSNNNNQYNIGEKYLGSESARQDQFDCVCVPYNQCPATDIVGRRDDLILPLDPRNLPTEIEAESDTNSTRVTKDVQSQNVTDTTEVKKISKRQVTPVQGEGAPGNARGSKTVTFPNNRRKRDTDQTVPASIDSENKETLESVHDSDDSSEGRALSHGKRQSFYQPQGGRPPFQQNQVRQCGPQQVCCRRPIGVRAPHQQQQYQPKCGVRNAQGINGRIKNPAYVDGDSEFGEYPWQAAILKKDAKESVYVCGGTLIDDQHIMTAAHCVKTYSGFDLRVRLGEWDVNHDVEFYPYVERDVISVHIHPEYYAGTLDNDLAILKLSQPVDIINAPHITPACLPDKYSDFTGARCWTTGWGKDSWEYGKYQNILKEVDVPIIGDAQCQAQLRQTRLGYSYKLNPGFICAGGEEGKDACKGDGGGPLVCERAGTWQVVGIVSWGIGCGQPNVPGVYVRVSHYLDWIQQLTRKF